MQAWLVILIVLVILSSVSSIALAILVPYSRMAFEKSIEEALAEGVAGLSADAAREKVKARANKDDIYYKNLLTQDNATCPNDREYSIVIEIKDGKATGVVNYCMGHA